MRETLPDTRGQPEPAKCASKLCIVVASFVWAELTRSTSLRQHRFERETGLNLHKGNGCVPSDDRFLDGRLLVSGMF